MIKLIVQGRKGEVEVAEGSLTLNDVIDNISLIKLKFRNGGDTGWMEESFSVKIGASYFKFGGGMTAHKASVRRSPGMDYMLNAEILEQSGKERYIIVVSAVIKDENNKWEEKDFELIYVTEPKTEAVFSNVMPGTDKIKQPNIMKRNARYRGQRESEKTLFDHQEQILDIRSNFIDIRDLTILQDKSLNSWFHGENEAPIENTTFSAANSYDFTSGRSTYSFAPYIETRAFQSLMVQLDGVQLVNERDYIHTDGVLKILIALTGSTLRIAYTATIPVTQQRMVGLYEIHQNVENVSERTRQLNERMNRYEDARQ